MAVILQALLLLWVLAAHAAAAHVLAARWLPGERLSRRLLAAGVLLAALLCATAQGLLLLRLFRAAPLGLAALLPAAFAAWAAHRRGWGASLRADAGGVLGALRGWFALPGGWFFWPAGFMVLFLALRGLLAPPLSWDALAFHMVVAGWLVQEGAPFTLGFPDTLGILEHHPRLFESLVALLMLPFHSDLPANLANFFFGLLGVLGFYVAGGALGVPERRLRAGVALAAFLPAFAAYWPTQYVDPAAAGLAMAGTALAAAWFSGGPWALAPLGALGLSLGFAMKPYGITAVAAGAVLLTAFGLARRVLSLRRAAVLCLAAAAGLSHYGQMAVRHGNPMYPFPLRVFGRSVGEAHPGLVRYIDEAARRQDEWFAGHRPGAKPSRLLGAAYSARKVFSQSAMTLGPAPFLFGVLGLGLLWRMRNRWLAALMALNILGAWAAFLNPEIEGLRLYYTVSYARILVFPSFLCILLGLGAWARIRAADLLPWALALPGLALVVPARMLAPDWVLLGAAAVLFGAAAVFVRWRLHDGLAFLLAAGLFALPYLQGHRDRLRHEYWTRSYDLFPLSQQTMPLARELDRPGGMRLAVAFGEDRWGAEWAFHYPLMGSRLQNTLQYVPAARSGEVLDAPELARAEAEPAVWFRRLLEARIDAVVLARPWTVEYDWVMKSRGLFTPLAIGEAAAAFEVRKR
jgi:hypothetical protein